MHTENNSIESLENIIKWNDTERIFPNINCIHKQFENQVYITPDHIAVVCEDKNISYRELNNRANCIAYHLQEKGIKPNDVIGIYLDVSIDAIISMLGILKAGGTFLPIDTSYPQQRSNYMLEAADTKLIISQHDIIQASNFKIPCIDIHSPELYEKYTKRNPKNISKISDNIYMLYTSGTTGKPKGTILSHLGVSNLLHWYIDYCNLNTNDKILIISSLSFDLTYKNVFGALLTGAQLHLAKINPFDPCKINEIITKNRITFINCTPSVFYTLIEYNELSQLQTLRQVCLGGESINARRLTGFITACPYTKITNTYGPTECTDLACAHTLTLDEIIQHNEIPIGKPLPNVKVIILNENNEISGIDEPGELYIGGIGVTQGYISNISETQNRFIDNPFPKLSILGNKIYKTGDQAKWLKNGNIQYIGRLDEQIKLRGLRIEPSEIEKLIVSITSVKQAIVICNKVSEIDQRLEAYLVTTYPNFDLISIKNELASQLPDYMIPSHYFYIDQLPISSNGKLDKSALRSLGTEIFIRKKDRYPRNHDEEILLDIWSNVLIRPKSEISIDDHFFDLGGYSLLATQVNLRIKRIFNINLPLDSLFIYPTISALAREIETIRKKDRKQIVIADIIRLNLQKSELSFSQKRIWFLSKLLPNSGFYNLPSAFSIKGNLNLLMLKKALGILINRHEILRTAFIEEDGTPYQVVHEFTNINNYMNEIDLRENESFVSKEISKNQIEKDANQPFNLETPFLLRMKIFILPLNTIIMYINMHHIILDGWSWNIFKKELSEIYNSLINNEAINLNSREIQYIDYAIWQNAHYTPEYLEESKNYWCTQLQTIDDTAFPTDFPRSPNPEFKGKRIQTKLTKSIYKNLENISRSNNITFFTTLITTFILSLYKYSGNLQFYIATPAANRLEEPTENLLGYLINTVIFSSKINPELTINDFLLKNKETTNQLLVHQFYPFEKLVDNLNIKRDLTINPISQIMFSFQNHQFKNFSFLDTRIENVNIDTHYSRFDIELQIWNEDDGLSVDLFFNTETYKESTIHELLKQFTQLLESLPSLVNEKLLNLYYSNNKMSISKGNSISWIKPLIYEYIAIQLKLNPENSRLNYNNKTLTYTEINISINRTADLLLNIGLVKGDRVVILAEKSNDSLIILLACLKLGLVFVPLSLKNPLDRIEYIIHDVSASLIFTDNEDLLKSKKSLYNIKILDLRHIQNSTYHYSRSKAPITVNENDPSYIMYTSGSTGKPKGVIVSHKNLCNAILSIASIVKFTQQDHWLALTELSFDISLLELLTPFVTGGSLTLVDKGLSDNFTLLKDVISHNNITVIQATPSFWKLFIASGWKNGKNLKIICGGEVLSRSLANQLLNTGAQLWNAYGPTETTIWSLLENISHENKEIFIGKPIFNTECYIVNDNNLISPIKQKGELYISGDSVALGYWNVPSESKFLKITLHDDQTKRCYRTGDHVIQDENGNFTFNGRMDNQIKLNGFRIEITEIEHTLMNHPYIDQASIIINTKEHENFLSAYISVNNTCHNNFSHLANDDWKLVFDNIYDLDDSQDNNTYPGWISSYNRQLLPSHEMDDWLDCCANLIKDIKPSSILEIGCGLGHLISKLSDICDNYIAVDMSASAIDKLTKKRLPPNVSIHQACAHEAVSYLDGFVDTVIMNSVIQYFPSIKYLECLLEELITKLPKNSTIVLCDVKNYDLAKLFYATLLKHNQKIKDDSDKFIELIENEIISDGELWISPKYFLSLKKKITSIDHVEIRPKSGKYINELNKYRYDVILHIKNDNKSILEPTAIIDCYEEGISLEKILNSVEKQKNTTFLFKNIAHPFLLEDYESFPLLSTNLALNKLKLASLSLQAFMSLASALEFSAISRLSNQSSSLYDIALYPKNYNLSATVFSYKNDIKIEDIHLYHEPDNREFIIQEIKDYLITKLPYYMIPSELNILQNFPLNANGKIDKKILEKKVHQGINNSSPHMNSRFTSNTTLLESIWTNLLSVQTIDQKDNFFDLGGHSLLAIQLLAKSNRAFNVNLSLYDFYVNPTFMGHLHAIQKLCQPNLEDASSSKLANTHKHTLFIIPPIDGNSAWYESLIEHLKQEFTCIALEQSYEIMKEGVTVELIAATYIDKIKSIQNTGTYRLIGWSFGGLIALEICNQLLTLGEEIEPPILIDSPPPQNSQAMHTASRNIELLHSNLSKKGSIDNFIYFNSLAYTQYSPNYHLLSKAILISATNNNENKKSKIKSEYNTIIEIDVFNIENSDHYSIIRSPHAGKVAEKIIHTLT